MTNYHLWRKEKSRKVIEYLASALKYRQTPSSRKSISFAIRDAAKLLTLELQIETGMQLHDLPDEITNAVIRCPEQAENRLKQKLFELTRTAHINETSPDVSVDWFI